MELNRCRGITRKGIRCSITSTSRLADDRGRMICAPLQHGCMYCRLHARPFCHIPAIVPLSCSKARLTCQLGANRGHVKQVYDVMLLPTLAQAAMPPEDAFSLDRLNGFAFAAVEKKQGIVLPKMAYHLTIDRVNTLAWLHLLVRLTSKHTSFVAVLLSTNGRFALHTSRRNNRSVFNAVMHQLEASHLLRDAFGSW